MHLSIFVLACILLGNGGISGHETVFPMQDCVGIFHGDFTTCANSLTEKIVQWQQWTNQKRDQRCGFPCTSQLRGRFHGFKWMWEGKFQCERKAPGIVGVATKYSRNGAIEWATIDFLRKAVAAGHIQPGDAICEDISD